MKYNNDDVDVVVTVGADHLGGGYYRISANHRRAGFLVILQWEQNNNTDNQNVNDNQWTNTLDTRNTIILRWLGALLCTFPNFLPLSHCSLSRSLLFMDHVMQLGLVELQIEIQQMLCRPPTLRKFIPMNAHSIGSSGGLVITVIAPKSHKVQSVRQKTVEGLSISGSLNHAAKPIKVHEIYNGAK